MTISTDQIESLAQSAQRIADTKRDELHAERQRVHAAADAIAQLLAAIAPALPHIVDAVKVTVAPNVQRAVGRRGIRVIGPDFDTPITPIYSWPVATAVYLADDGTFFEVHRSAPDKPADQCAGDWREREHPRCVTFTKALTLEGVAEYPAAAVEIAKALNRHVAAMGAK